MRATPQAACFALVLCTGVCLFFAACGRTSQEAPQAQPAATAQPGPPAAPQSPAATPATSPATAPPSGPAAAPAPGTGEKTALAPSGGPAPAAPPSGAVAPAVPPPPRTATLHAGKEIPIITASLISTKSQKTGDRFGGTLAEDLVVGDWVIARQGARVAGHVASADPGGRVQGVASISLTLDELTLADGRQLALVTDTAGARAKSSAKKDAAKIAGGAGVGGVIGAIAGGGKGAAIGAAIGGGAGTAATLATRGEAATIPSRTRLTFTLAAPVEVAEKR